MQNYNIVNLGGDTDMVLEIPGYEGDVVLDAWVDKPNDVLAEFAHQVSLPQQNQILMASESYRNARRHIDEVYHRYLGAYANAYPPNCAGLAARG